MQLFHRMLIIIQKHAQIFLFHQQFYNTLESRRKITIYFYILDEYNRTLTTREKSRNVSRSSSMLLAFVVNNTI